MKGAENSTEFDGGPAGFSAGDGEYFVDDLRRRSRSIGSQAGSCTVALVSDPRLVAGRYAGASGEAVGTFRVGSDAEIIDWQVRLD